MNLWAKQCVSVMHFYKIILKDATKQRERGNVSQHIQKNQVLLHLGYRDRSTANVRLQGIFYRSNFCSHFGQQKFCLTLQAITNWNIYVISLRCLTVTHYFYFKLGDKHQGANGFIFRFAPFTVKNFQNFSTSSLGYYLTNFHTQLSTAFLLHSLQI